MDITHNQKKKKRGSELTSERSSEDKHIADIKNSDFEDRREAIRAEKYGKLTLEQLESIHKKSQILLKADKTFTPQEAYDLAWEQVMGKRL